MRENKIIIKNSKEKWIVYIGEIKFLEFKKIKKFKGNYNYIDLDLLNYLILNQILREFGLSQPLKKYINKKEKCENI